MPPPPPPGGAIPPPRGVPSFGSALPPGMKKKKSFQPDTMMKRLNWNQIKVNMIQEKSLWIGVDEEKFENQDLFTRLMATFGQKKTGKKLKNVEIDKPQKKVKDLKVLDSKSAQNLCEFMFCETNL